MLYSHFCFSWELSEIGAVKPDGARLLREAPAAFGLLCVETLPSFLISARDFQPPSGCCVLKLTSSYYPNESTIQPPSGCCVLKRYLEVKPDIKLDPAAFGLLCVETLRQILFLLARSQPPSGCCVLKQQSSQGLTLPVVQPPSGCCVLKPWQHQWIYSNKNQPPSGCCVLKPALRHPDHSIFPSRLRAAVC